MHVDEAVLAPVRERFGTPDVLRWEGEISDVEWTIATHNPVRTHDVTLFILDPARRLALIRKPHFAEDVWRPPGGDFVPAGAAGMAYRSPFSAPRFWLWRARWGSASGPSCRSGPGCKSRSSFIY